MKTFDLIAALDQKNGIGKEGKLPWALSGDMQRFKTITLASSERNKINAVIMGRKTWESILPKFRPLIGRLNVVLTKKADYPFPRGVLKAQSLESAVTLLDNEEYQKKIDHIFVIGGASVYREAIEHPLCRKIYLTKIVGDFSCDCFFPEFEKNFEKIESLSSCSDRGITYSFCTYRRI